MTLLDSPVFIIGNPRSGTTLIRLMLSAHSEIVIPPESGFAVWYHDTYKNWQTLFTENERIIDTFIDDLFRARKFENWDLNKNDITKYLYAKKPLTYSDLIALIYLYYAKKIGKKIRYWGDKNNFHLNYINLLKDLFPGIHFIHIIRDGRSVACSYKKIMSSNIQSQYAPKLPRDISKIAEEWSQNMQTVRSSFQIIKYENVQEIRFEDLIQEPKSILRNICDALDLKYEKRMLEYYKLSEKDGNEPPEFMQWKQKNKLPLLPEEVDRFKRELSADEIAIFQKIAGTELKSYRYEIQ
jgi:hypothetical protein